jgi:hypothetical protein
MEPTSPPKTEVLEKAPNQTIELTDSRQHMPMMEINVGSIEKKKDEKEIVADDTMINLYGEILDMCRDDRKEIDDLLGNFVNMVINEGDASTSSKEALVNLMKMRSDIANNMTRVFDLLARIKMRDKSIPEVVAKQVNKFSIGGGNANKRKMLETLAKEAKK